MTDYPENQKKEDGVSDDKTMRPVGPNINGTARSVGMEGSETVRPVGMVKTPPLPRSTGYWKIGDEILGRYLVLELLGQGGMGVVYRCLDLIGGIDIAVKSLPPELSRNKVEMEEVRENYQLVSNLIHKNIANYKSLERDSDGEYYLVMEYVEGMELRMWIRRMRKDKMLTNERILSVLSQIADALDWAHKHGIVHRDVKPDNIMISSDDTAKILDFGLAAQIRTSMGHISNENFARAGTNLYKSPEQWIASGRQGPATDQYSLAVVAYEMLAGYLPFESDDTDLLRRAVLWENPEKIEGIPAEANDVLAKALSKKPEDRYGSCVDFIDALMEAFELTEAEDSDVRHLTQDVKDDGETSNKTQNEQRIRELLDTISSALDGKDWPMVWQALVELESLDSKLADVWRNEYNNAFKKVAEEESKQNEEEEKKQKCTFDEKGQNNDEGDERQNIGQRNNIVSAQKEKKSTKLTLWSITILICVSLCACLVRMVISKQQRYEQIEKKYNQRSTREKSKDERLKLTQEQVKTYYKNQSEKEKKNDDMASSGSLSNREASFGDNDKVIDLGNGVMMKLKPIKAGSFWMGSPVDEAGRSKDEIRHRVTLTKEYWLGETEVTQGQWNAVMGTTLLDQANKMYPGEGSEYIAVENNDYPMYYVNWDEAMEFCRVLTERERSAGKLSSDYEYSLPSEAQWEYACRAGTDTALYNGPITIKGEHNAEELDTIAWYGGNSNVGYKGRGWNTSNWKDKQYSGEWAGPREVGGKKANGFGLYDMLGNVWEWCRDGCNEGSGVYPDDEVTDPQGVSNGAYRMNRGGAWDANAEFCRSAYRFCNKPSYRRFNLGFRVALVPIQYMKPKQTNMENITNELKIPDVKVEQIAQPTSVSLPNGGAMVLDGTIADNLRLWKNLENKNGGDVINFKDGRWSDIDNALDNHKLLAQKEKEPEYKIITLPKGVKLKLVKIKAGSFTMGSPKGELGRLDGEKQHLVTISKDFWLGQYELTQAQWKTVGTAREKDNDFHGDKLPVENVSWIEAKAFCDDLNRRCKDQLPEGYCFDLPTEAQWEYACRAGTTKALNNEENLTDKEYNCENLKKVAWYNYRNDENTTHPVGLKLKNDWGLYDMHGNVGEWCRDWYGGYPDGMVTDPQGPSKGSYRVQRGGGWNYSAIGCRSAYRGGNAPSSRSSVGGFRVALVPVQ